MLHFAFYILFKFNLFIEKTKFDKNLNNMIFDLHVKNHLRNPNDPNDCTMQTLAREYQEAKIKNYPCFASAYNFNCYSKFQTMSILQFNQAYQTHCKIQLSYDSSNFNYWTTALKEAEELYVIHDLVDDAFHEHFNLFKRRKALSKLRDLIGEKDFYNGILPPCVPIWRFELFD
jgi:hypothetical protein